MNMREAEVKDRKFREPLTCNDDGNPEPSPENREGAETRHGLCLKCNGQIPSWKYKSAKFCSDKCRLRFNTSKCSVKQGRIKKQGVGSGGNQLGTDNHMYKTGIGTYKVRGLEHYGTNCNRCNGTKNIVVHHINEDRTNNTLENLEVLCRKCHQEHHHTRDIFGRYNS